MDVLKCAFDSTKCARARHFSAIKNFLFMIQSLAGEEANYPEGDAFLSG